MSFSLRTSLRPILHIRNVFDTVYILFDTTQAEAYTSTHCPRPPATGLCADPLEGPARRTGECLLRAAVAKTWALEDFKVAPA